MEADVSHSCAVATELGHYYYELVICPEGRASVEGAAPPVPGREPSARLCRVARWFAAGFNDPANNLTTRGAEERTAGREPDAGMFTTGRAWLQLLRSEPPM